MVSVNQLHSQEVIASSGDCYKSNDLTISYTFGEVTTNNYLKDALFVSTGFQQPTINIMLTGIDFELFTFLEGPFKSNDMSADLNSGNYLPLNQPYNLPPWNYGGTESVQSIPNSDIVDWVLIELRDAPAVSVANTVLKRKAAFLLKNGSIVDINGEDLIQFDGSVCYNLFVVVWHRNHLAIMSANPLVEHNGVFDYNFTSNPTMAFGGSSAQKELSPGLWGMIASDGNSDGQIDNKDKDDIWLTENGSTGYFAGDYNMDGNVDLLDKIDIWTDNVGRGSRVTNGYYLYEPFNGTNLNTDLWEIYDNTGYHENGLNMYIDDTLIINRGPTNDNNGSYGIISKNQYDNVTEVSVDVWMSSMHNWQDYKVNFITPIGDMGYYNYGSQWWIHYTDNSGSAVGVYFEIGNGYVPDNKYSIRIKDTGNNLVFEWNNGSGFEDVFSTANYSSSLHHQGTEYYKKILMTTSDRGYTKYDNLQVK